MQAVGASAAPPRSAAAARGARMLLAALAVAALPGCAIVDYEQRRWIFQPISDAWPPSLPAVQGMDEVWIDYRSDHPEQPGQAVRLHGLWLPRPEPGAPALLFLHGVRWDVRASSLRMRRLHALGFSVLAIDYRGFGRSSPAMPSETLVAEDARAAWAWLARAQPQASRYVFGHSLGAAVAVRLAQEVDDESGLIVEGAFTSTFDVLRSTRWGWLPVGGLITQRFDAASRIAQVGSPVLVVHGGDDTMVDPRLGRALYERARSPKRFVLVPGAVHEDADRIGHELYRSALQELFGLPAPRLPTAHRPAASAAD